jgi:hypothetical protein
MTASNGGSLLVEGHDLLTDRQAMPRWFPPLLLACRVVLLFSLSGRIRTVAGLVQLVLLSAPGRRGSCREISSRWRANRAANAEQVRSLEDNLRL